jgi:exopolysaccharide biosynthesis polyprenyl glycosylphosphotransferase
MQERNSTEQRLALFVLDMAAFFAALNAAIYLRYSANLPFAKGGAAPWHEIFVAYPFVALAWLLISATLGSYRVRQSALEEIGAVLRATLLTFLAVLSATFFYRGFSYSRGMMGFFMPLVLVFVSSERLVFRALKRRALARFAGRSRVAVLGRSKIGDALLAALREDAEYYEVVGRIESSAARGGSSSSEAAAVSLSEARPGARVTGSAERAPAAEVGTAPDDDLPVLGTVRDLDVLCAADRFDTLIVVERQLSDAVVLESIECSLRHQVSWNMIPGVHDLLLDRARVALVDGIPLVGMRGSNIVGFNWMMKRLFDVGVSGLLILLASPVMIGVAVAIKLSSTGPVFYVQKRVGYRGRVFPFLKFRSMHVGNDDHIHREYTRRWITENRAHSEEDGAKTFKIVNDPRIFPVGRLIRKYSIDELPQLFNVLRGEMSLIGPRPALPYEVEVYREWHRRRFEAPPGITGLWQVSGRNHLSFDEMIKLDIDYLENWSFLRDLQILVRTIRVVLFEHAY